ncbi:MAG: DUF2911 domain-containing protein [Candidatus Eisenbacteria bacterium]|nr:DUF2911 domain-containing protein [Candidatus Eisenbacteria bacterium]
MIRRLSALVPGLALALTLAVPAAADDTGMFLIRLGQDTTSIERYQRGADRLEIDQVGRAPRVMQRHLTYEYAKGKLAKLTLVATPAGAAAPTQTVTLSFDPDSARMRTENASGPPVNAALAIPPGALVMSLSAPWALYEEALMKLAAQKGDSLRMTMWALGAANPYWLSLHRIGRDSVSVMNEHLDQFHVRIDKTGHILGVLPVAGTGKVSVERVASLDVPGLTASFAAREKAGSGMGVLSPRDSVKTTVAGAALSIDYGRPGKRGRAIFGAVVPYGEVWRTGANAATQFRTDKALDFGGVMVPAGFYTLWTIPAADGWKLIVNGETGQWGTEHKAAKDLFTIPMKLATLPTVAERFTISVDPSATGGVLNLDWDTTRASAAFTVKP